MKKRKIIIGSIIGISVIMFVSLAGLMVANKIKNRNFEERGYLSKGQYFETFIDENGLYSNEYSIEEIEQAKDYSIAAAIMREWHLITEEQAKNLKEPLTKELVAQTVVNNMFFRQTHIMEIKDISKCYDKQAIIDAIGMGIFELENGKFNPNDYMTTEDVEMVFEKVRNIENEEDDLEDNENEIFPVDTWKNLKITINNQEYNITPNMKVSDFINNGWKATEDYEEILNQTIEDIQKSIIDNDSDIYIGFNLLELKQEQLNLMLYFDTRNPSSKVIDSQVFSLYFYSEDESKSFDVYFNDFKLGEKVTERDFTKIFGKKNIGISSYESYYYYSSYIKLSDNFVVQVELKTRIDTNKLVGLDIYLVYKSS